MKQTVDLTAANELHLPQLGNHKGVNRRRFLSHLCLAFSCGALHSGLTSAIQGVFIRVSVVKA